MSLVLPSTWFWVLPCFLQTLLLWRTLDPWRCQLLQTSLFLLGEEALNEYLRTKAVTVEYWTAWPRSPILPLTHGNYRITNNKVENASWHEHANQCLSAMIQLRTFAFIHNGIPQRSSTLAMDYCDHKVFFPVAIMFSSICWYLGLSEGETEI